VSEREGNTNAPRVDENEVRADNRGGSGPRRVEDVRRDHESSRGSEYGSSSSDTERGTSWVSVVLGWLAALGAGLILSGIVSGIVGTIFGTAGRQGLTEGGTTALIGLLITLLLAFLIGGYVAGRLASRSGFKHGLLVPLLALVVTIVLAIVGGLLGISFIDQLSGITLPQGAQQSAQQAAPQQGLGTILTVGGILALLFPFIGGAIGGLWGARTGSRRP
jgi:fatty acid desaturase